MELLTQLAALHNCEKSSKAVQTSLQGQSSVGEICLQNQISVHPLDDISKCKCCVEL